MRRRWSAAPHGGLSGPVPVSKHSIGRSNDRPVEPRAREERAMEERAMEERDDMAGTAARGGPYTV